MHRCWHADKSTTAVSLLFALLAAGCAGAQVHRALDGAIRGQTYQVTALSKIPKEKISLGYVLRIAESGSGPLTDLIFSAATKRINESRASTAEHMIAPLLQATADIDFRTQYWEALEKELPTSPWLKIKRLDRRALGYSKEEMGTTTTPLLILTTFYQISTNSQVLMVQTLAQLYLKDLNAPPDYFGYCTYYSQKIGQYGEKDDKAIALWAANGAAAYRQALAEGIDQNMKMLRLDLVGAPAQPTSEKGQTLSLDFVSPVTGEVETLNGKVLSRMAARVILRDFGGNLFSVDAGSAEGGTASPRPRR